MSLQADIQKEINKLYADDEWVELFTVDATAFGGPLFRFTNNPGPTGVGVVMAGLTYTPIPILGAGFDVSSSGTLPNPTITISNVNHVVRSAAIVNGDLIGAKFERRRTKGKFLDAATFPRRNLLNYSQDWSNAYWTKAQVTAALVTDPVSPFSKKEAFRLTETAVTNSHYVQAGSVTVTVGQTYTFSVYLRKYGTRSATIELGQSTQFTTAPRATINLDTGVVSNVTNGTATATDMGNGWYRCKITAVCTVTGATEARVHASIGSTLSYLGAAGEGVYVFGAQFENSTGMTSYQLTTASHQPFANPAAIIGPEVWRIEQLIEDTTQASQFMLATNLDKMRLRFGRQVLKDVSVKNVYAPGVARTRTR